MIFPKHAMGGQCALASPILLSHQKQVATRCLELEGQPAGPNWFPGADQFMKSLKLHLNVSSA